MDIRADGYLSGVSCPSIQLLSHLDAFFIHPDIYNKNKKQNKQNFFAFLTWTKQQLARTYGKFIKPDFQQ